MKDIHDIRPPVQVGFDPVFLKTALITAGGIILFILVFFLIKKYLKKKRQPRDLKYLPAPLPPHEAAVKELKFLFQQQIPDPRLFYFDLTAVLRRYIGRSFGINAIEMTSQEFTKGIALLDLDKTVKKEMTRFLKLSDSFKYAGLVPEKDRVKEDLLFVREVIGRIEKDLTAEKQQEDL